MLFVEFTPPSELLSPILIRLVTQLSKQTPWRRFHIVEPMIESAKLPQEAKLKQPPAGITFAHPGVAMQVCVLQTNSLDELRI